MFAPDVKTTPWFHGDRSRREAFTDQRDRRRTESDPNALGPGIYWAVNPETARGYAWPDGWLYRAMMRVPLERIMLPNTRLRPGVVKRLIELCPVEIRVEALTNFGEHPAYALAAAVSAYTQVAARESALDACVGLFHDVYSWQHEPFLAAMPQIGFDCYLAPDIGHLVVWNPKIIDVLDETPRTIL